MGVMSGNETIDNGNETIDNGQQSLKFQLFALPLGWVITLVQKGIEVILTK